MRTQATPNMAEKTISSIGRCGTVTGSWAEEVKVGEGTATVLVVVTTSSTETVAVEVNRSSIETVAVAVT